MPPQVNAAITLVRQATAATGGRDDYDAPGVEPAGAGNVKWQPVAPATGIDAYYREQTDRVADAGAVRVVTVRTLIVDTDAFVELELDTDDVVEFTVGGQARAGIAHAITRTDAPEAGFDPELVTTRIELGTA